MEKFDWVLWCFEPIFTALPNCCQSVWILSAQDIFIEQNCYAIHKRYVASTISITEAQIQFFIWWRLSPLIVPDSTISVSTIISTGHPNGSEPLSLAVSHSVQ